MTLRMQTVLVLTMLVIGSDAAPLFFRMTWKAVPAAVSADIQTLTTKGTLLDVVDLSKVDEVGFVDLTPGSGHGLGGFSDVGWIEIYGKAVKRGASTN